ncbi:MAG TPA: PTS sugar transporter subunit IIA [Acidobacteriota bacterium]|nr:PTS sugar transporter subunit IIA [Acidobacteriota bacterium]
MTTDQPLVGVLVVTHGHLANELVAVAEMIVGEINHIVPVSVGWHVDVNQSRKEIEQAVHSVDKGKGVVVLTDMFGGTPSTIALSFLRKGELEIVTGVNLPMIIKLAQQTGNESVTQLAAMAKEQGQKQISIASELLGE